MRNPICSFAIDRGEIRLGAKGASRGPMAKLVARRLRGENVRWPGRVDLSWATPFQQRVYRELRKIGWGKTITYGGLARRVGSSARAIGGAMRANRLPLLIPCHRVVGSGGALVGFTGAGVGVKQLLLDHEK